MGDSLINIAPPTDPITAVANLGTAVCGVASKYIDFLMTTAGQKVAEQQLQDWQEIKAAVQSLGGKIDKLIEGAQAQIAKEK